MEKLFTTEILPLATKSAYSYLRTMRTIDKAATNKRALEETIQLARTGLAKLMPRQPSGSWHIMARWTEGKLDHLEPRWAGDDQPHEWDNVAYPTGHDMRRRGRLADSALNQRCL